MNEKRTFPWIEAAVLGFSVLGMLLLGRTLLRNWYIGSVPINEYAALLLLAVVGFSGYRGLRLRLDGAPTVMGREYLSAWHIFRHQRWLMALAFALAALNLVGGLTESLISRHYIDAQVFSEPDDVFGNAAFGWSLPWEYLSYHLPLYFSTAIMRSLASFFPGATVGWSFPLSLTLLAVVVFLPVVRNKLPQIDGREARVLRRLIVPIGISTALVAVGLLVFCVFWTKSSAGNFAFLPGYASIGITVVVWIWRLALVSAIMAALAGSLKRFTNGGRMTAETFIADAVRFWVPVAGFYAAIAAVGVCLSYLQLRDSGVSALINRLWILPLMLVVYALVVHEIGVFRGIRRGVRDLLAHKGELLLFVGPGVILLSSLLILVEMFQRTFPLLSIARMMVGSCVSGLDTLVSVFMVVAVWEFYRTIDFGESDAVQRPQRSNTQLG